MLERTFIDSNENGKQLRIVVHSRTFDKVGNDNIISAKECTHKWKISRKNLNLKKKHLKNACNLRHGLVALKRKTYGTVDSYNA